ncbi:MAG: hypothetical protein V2B15_13505 [Bacteroidota bacterium]
MDERIVNARQVLCRKAIVTQRKAQSGLVNVCVQGATAGIMIQFR